MPLIAQLSSETWCAKRLENALQLGIRCHLSAEDHAAS
jgi:hypothetical protein